MSTERLSIFINNLIQNRWRVFIEFPLLIEFLSCNVDLIKSSDHLIRFLYKGLCHSDRLTQKRSLFILSKKVSNFHTDPKWTTFSTYYDSLYQTNTSIMEPILQNISNFPKLLDHFEIELICTFWSRAISNEFQKMKILALEYFFQMEFSALQFSTE